MDIANRPMKEFRKYAKNKTMIPADVNVPKQMTIDYYFTFLRHLGFKVLGKEGQQVIVKYPNGWKKTIVVPNVDDFMYLLDDKNSRRAAIFYKYLGGITEKDVIEHKLDIKKHELKNYKKIVSYINWMPRYVTKVRNVVEMPIGKFKKDRDKINSHYNSDMFGGVYDQKDASILFTTKPQNVGIEYNEDREQNVEYSRAKQKIVVDMFDTCEKWLAGEYPEYKNITAYWEEE